MWAVALSHPRPGHVAPTIRLLEEVVDPLIEQRANAGHAQEVVLDVAVGEDRQRQRGVRAAQDGTVVVAVITRTVEAVAQVGHEAVDGIAQIVGSEQVVLDHPAGQHAVAHLVAQERIRLVEQIEQRRKQIAAVCPGGTSASEATIDSHSARSITVMGAQSGIRAEARPPRCRRLCHTFGVRRRTQLLPWKVAGRMTETQASADEVVQTTGWVFNNETGDTLTLAEFVATGDTEVPVYLDRFDLAREDDEQRTLIEIGCGIGRMTCAFTRRYGIVFACDLDAGFLERCREAVARFGKVDRLRTIEVTEGAAWKCLTAPATSPSATSPCSTATATTLSRSWRRRCGPWARAGRSP